MGKSYYGPERRENCDEVKALRILLLGDGTPGGALARLEESRERIDQMNKSLQEMQMLLVKVPEAVKKVWAHEAVINENKGRWQETYADVKILVAALNKVKGLNIALIILTAISVIINIMKGIK